MSRKSHDAPYPILIVEDDELMRVSLEDRFRLEGLAAVSATTVDGARILLASPPKPGLVMTDVRLPDGNGSMVFELCQTLHPPVPVILMTAFATVADAVRLVKAGALDYLEKPFDLDELVELVKVTFGGAGTAVERGLRSSVEEAEREAIAEALIRNGWAITKTATALGISRKSLWEKMRRYHIERG